jgi:hypothetical protein
MKKAGWSSILIAAVMLTVAVIADAQQPASFRVSWLSAGKGDDTASFLAFRSGLRDYGYVEGRTSMRAGANSPASVRNSLPLSWYGPIPK